MAASVAYGFLPIFSKLVLDQGVDAENTVIYRFFFAMLASLALCFLQKLPLRLSKSQAASVIVFGLLGFGLTAFFLASSYVYLPVGLATMFHFTYPAFVVLIMAVFFRDKPTGFKIGSVVVATLGMMMLTDLRSGLSLTGVLLAMSSGLSYAVFVTACNKSSLSTIPAMVSIFYLSGISFLFFLAKGSAAGNFALPPNVKALFFSILVSCVCTVLALYLLTYGIRAIGSTRASILNMLEPLVSLAAGAVFFAEPLSVRTLTGSMFVMASIFLIAFERPAKTKSQR